MKFAKYRIRKNDEVKVTMGRESGKTGRVVRVLPKKDRVLVEKVNFIKRHTRPSAKNRQGGIVEKEAPLPISSVMILCPKCKGPVRVRIKVLEDETRARACHRCGELLDH